MSWLEFGNYTYYNLIARAELKWQRKLLQFYCQDKALVTWLETTTILLPGQRCSGMVRNYYIIFCQDRATMSWLETTKIVLP